MVKFTLIGKPLAFDKTFIYFWFNQMTIFLTKSFNKTFWPPYWLCYIIDLICFLFVCIPICLITNLLTYLFMYLPTHPFTYLSTYLFVYLPTHPPTHLTTYHLHNVNVCYCMIYKIWRYCTKWINNHLIIYWPLDVNKW
jgi:hypothetical protein